MRGKTFERKVKQWGASKGSSELQARETQHFCSNLKDFDLNLNFGSNLKDFGLKPKKKVVYKTEKAADFTIRRPLLPQEICRAIMKQRHQHKFLSTLSIKI